MLTPHAGEAAALLGVGRDATWRAIVRCECGLFKALAATTKQNDVPLGFCNGPRPWLGSYSKELCGGGGDKPPLPNRLLVRAASNAYFAQTLSAISIPEPGAALRSAAAAARSFP